MPDDPGTRSRSGPVFDRDARIVGALGFVLALLVLVVGMASIALPPPGVDVGGYVRQYRPPESGFEAMLNLGDGQAYAALAQDPFLTRGNEPFLGPAFPAAFAQRPAFYGLVSLTSLGQGAALPVTFTLVQAAAFGLLAATIVAVMHHRGRRGSEQWALLLVVYPGAVVSLRWYGPELLGVALALLAFLYWDRIPPSRGLAVILLCAAVLTREYLILVPMVLAVHDVLIRRTGLRSVLPLALPAVTYVAVAAWVAWRTGGTAGQTTGLLRSPTEGLVIAVQSWGAPDFGLAALVLALIVALLIWRRTDLLTWVAVAFVLALPIGNPIALQTWEGLARLMLPVAAIALALLLPAKDVGGHRSADSLLAATGDR